MYILDALWRGEVTPMERYFKPDSHYRCLAGRAHEVYMKVYNELSEEGKQHYDELEKIRSEMESINEEEVFIEAFRMGAQIILDIVGTGQKTAGE